MTKGVDLLRKDVDRIALSATETADLDEHLDRVRQLTEALLDSEGSASLDTSALRAAGADDAAIRKLLRSVEAECIETLRGKCTTQDSAGEILRMRSVIQRSVPRQKPTQWCARLGTALSDDSGASDAADQRAILTFFRGLAAAMRDMVYAHDINGNMFYINDAGLRILKHSREELFEGLSVYDFVVQEYVDLVEARLESPGAVLRAPFSIEIYAKDGERIPIEIDTKPLLNETGDVVGVVGIARDLRLERRLQDQIQRTHAHLQHILANAPLAIVTTDTKAVIRDANTLAASLCGVATPKELIGSSLYALCEQGEERAIREAVTEVLVRGKEVRDRISMHTRFGSVLNCDILLTPILLPSGQTSGLLVLMSDVTEQLALEQSLRNSERLSALGQLIAGVAHEFNNPLTGIFGYAQYLLTSIEDPKARERLEKIMEEAQRCRRVVQSLLSFARRSNQPKAPQKINDLIREVLTLYEYQLRVDAIRVELDLAEELPPVSAVSQDLQRVFLNIISNAHTALCSVSARDHERVLTIRTFLQNQKVHIDFADNGPGISRAHLPRVFDPFFTTRKQGDGIGLGLSISYGIIQEHGGQIVVESTEEVGTTFTIILPIRHQP